MTQSLHDPQALLTPAEVAAMFRVDPKTVTRWAKADKLSCVRTLGGHRRYLASEVNLLLNGTGKTPVPVPPPPQDDSGIVSPSDEPVGLVPLPPPPATSGSSGGLPSSV